MIVASPMTEGGGRPAMKGDWWQWTSRWRDKVDLKCKYYVDELKDICYNLFVYIED